MSENFVPSYQVNGLLQTQVLLPRFSDVLGMSLWEIRTKSKVFLPIIHRKQESRFFRKSFALTTHITKMLSKQRDKVCNLFPKKQYSITMQSVLWKQSVWYNAIINHLKINHTTSWFYSCFHISVFSAETSISAM